MDADETMDENDTHRYNMAPQAESLDVRCVEAQEGGYGGGVAVPSNTP